MEITELTQIRVVDFLDHKDTSWISHWENGDALPNLISAIKLARFYQVSINELYPDLFDVVRNMII